MEQNNPTKEQNNPEEMREDQTAAPVEKPANLFDRFIEQFSSRDLKTRVWGVVFLGFGLFTVAIALAYWLLTHDFYVADEPGLESVKFIQLLLGK